MDKSVYSADDSHRDQRCGGVDLEVQLQAVVALCKSHFSAVQYRVSVRRFIERIGVVIYGAIVDAVFAIVVDFQGMADGRSDGHATAVGPPA